MSKFRKPRFKSCFRARSNIWGLRDLLKKLKKQKWQRIARTLRWPTWKKRRKFKICVQNPLTVTWGRKFKKKARNVPLHIQQDPLYKELLTYYNHPITVYENYIHYKRAVDTKKYNMSHFWTNSRRIRTDRLRFKLLHLRRLTFIRSLRSFYGITYKHIKNIARQVGALNYTDYKAQDYHYKIPISQRVHRYRKVSGLFVGQLEKRLDIILYRACFFRKILEAQQAILHGKIYVNYKKVTFYNYQVGLNDVITIDNSIYDKVFSCAARFIRRRIKCAVEPIYEDMIPDGATERTIINSSPQKPKLTSKPKLTPKPIIENEEETDDEVCGEIPVKFQLEVNKRGTSKRRNTLFRFIGQGFYEVDFKRLIIIISRTLLLRTRLTPNRVDFKLVNLETLR